MANYAQIPWILRRTNTIMQNNDKDLQPIIIPDKSEYGWDGYGTTENKYNPENGIYTGVTHKVPNPEYNPRARKNKKPEFLDEYLTYDTNPIKVGDDGNISFNQQQTKPTIPGDAGNENEILVMGDYWGEPVWKKRRLRDIIEDREDSYNETQQKIRNYAKDHQIGDFLNQNRGMSPSVSVEDSLKEAVDEGDTKEVENIIEKHPEEAQEALPEDTPIQEEAKQITEDDKPQNDEVNNEVVEDFVEKPHTDTLDFKENKMQNNNVEEKIENSPKPVETAQAITGSENNPLVKEASQIEDSNPHNDEINNKAVKKTFDKSNLYSGDNYFKQQQKRYIGSEFDVDRPAALLNKYKNMSDKDLVGAAFRGTPQSFEGADGKVYNWDTLKKDWDKISNEDLVKRLGESLYSTALEEMRDEVIPELEKASQDENYSSPIVNATKESIKRVQDFRKQMEDVSNYENEIDEYMRNNPEMYMDAARALTSDEFNNATRGFHPHEVDVLKKAWKDKRPRYLDDVISRKEANDALNHAYDIQRDTEKELGLKGFYTKDDGSLEYNTFWEEPIIELAFENLKRNNPNLKIEDLTDEDKAQMVQGFRDYAKSDEGKAALKSKEQLFKTRLEMNGYFKAREEADAAEKRYEDAVEALRSGSVQEKMDALRNLGVKVKKVKKGKKVDIVDENTGSSVEDVLEKELPDVKDTPTEDKTQKEESKMAERLSEDFENADDLYNYLEEEGYLEDPNPMTFDEGHTPEQPPREPGSFIKNPSVMLGEGEDGKEEDTTPDVPDVTDVTDIDATDDYGFDENASIDEDEVKSPYDFNEDYPGDYPEDDFYLGMTGEDREMAKAAMREDGKYHPIRPTDLIDNLDFTPEERELAKENLRKDLQLGKNGKVYKTLDQFHKERIDELTDLEKEILRNTLLETEEEEGEDGKEKASPFSFGIKSNRISAPSSSSGGQANPDIDMGGTTRGGRGSIGGSMLGRALGSLGGISGASSVSGGKQPNASMDTIRSVASKGPIPPKVNESNGSLARGGSNNSRPHSNGTFGSGPGMLFNKGAGGIKTVSTAPVVPVSPVEDGNDESMVSSIGDVKEAMIQSLESKIAQLSDRERESIGIGHKYKHFDWNGIPLDELSGSQINELGNIVDKMLRNH